MTISKLITICIFIFVIKTSIKCCCMDDKIKYYESLIKASVQQTKEYVAPTQNVEFKEGLDAEEILNYGYYDFIVVGGGTAGAIVASRLAEIMEWNILLIEAGEEENDFTSIPFYNNWLQKTSFNWGYITIPQTTACLGMMNNQCAAPRGKGLGGTNILNGMMYLRGTPADYDNWQQMGCTGWSWNDVFPYFIKMENSQVLGDIGLHGVDGLWNVEHNGPLSPLLNNFIGAAIEQNQTWYVDSNGPTLDGVFHIQFSEKYGQRQTTARAFLTNAQRKSNMFISLNSYVFKIEIDDQLNARSVLFVKNGKKYRAYAANEIIVSGGTYNSAQLLMLSGIGPQQELAQHSIEVIQDLPVGQNLKEHPFFIGIRFLTNVTETSESLSNQIRQYLDEIGPLTIPAALQGLGFLPFPGEPNHPEMEYIFQPIPNKGIPMNYELDRLKPEIRKNYVFDTPYQQFIIPIILLHEKSAGKVTLKSSNPIDFPNIDYNFFSDENNVDIKKIIDTSRFIMSFAETGAFQKINATFVNPPVCADMEQFSDGYWECLIRHLTSIIYHPVGTVPMGVKGTGVVDERLKVYGIQKLRVADASIFPTPVSGHTNAPTAMIGEKASDMIKQDNGIPTDFCLTFNI